MKGKCKDNQWMIKGLEKDFKMFKQLPNLTQFKQRYKSFAMRAKDYEVVVLHC